MADYEVSGEASLNPDHIVEDVEAIIAKLDELEETIARIDESIDELSHKEIDISVLIEGQDKLDELRLFLDEISNNDYTVKLRVDVNDKDKLDELYVEILELELHDHDVNLKVKVDDVDKARAQLKLLDDELVRNKKVTDDSSDSSKKFEFSLGMLAPLLIPASAGVLALVGGVGGLASAFGTMLPPLAMAAYGIKQTYTEISTLYTGLNAATQAALMNASTMGQMYNILERNSSAFDHMSSAEKNAVVNFVGLKQEMMYFVQDVKPEALTALSNGFDLIATAIAQLIDPAMQAAGAIAFLLGDFNKRLTDPTFQKFFDDMDKNIHTLVLDWGGGVLNIIEGIVAILDAFMPLGVDMSGGFLKMTQSFDTWAQHLGESQGFKKFVAGVEKDGPLILNILGQLALLIAHVVGAIGQTGGNAGFLSFLDRMLKDLNGFTGTHEGLTQAGGDLTLLAIGAAKLGPALGPIAEFLATPVGAIVGVIVALAAAFTVAYIKSKSFHDWVNSNFGPMFTKLQGYVTQFKQWFTGIWPEIQEVWQKYGSNIESIIVDHFGFIVTFIGGALKIIEGIVDLFVGILTGHWGTAWQGIEKIFTGAWSIIQGMFLEMFQTITNIFEMIWKVITTNASTAWGKIENLFTTYTSRIIGDVSKFFTNMVSSAVSGMVSLLTTIASRLATVGTWFAQLPGNIIKWLGDLGSLLVQAGRNIISGLINGIESMFGPLENVFNDLTSWIPDLKGPASRDAMLLYNAGQLTIKGYINGLESQYGPLQQSLAGLTNDIGNNFQKQINSNIGAKIDAAVNATMGVGGALGGNGNLPGAVGSSSVTVASGAITIYNPVAEPASTTMTSLSKQLTTVAKFGILQAPAR